MTLSRRGQRFQVSLITLPQPTDEERFALCFVAQLFECHVFLEGQVFCSHVENAHINGKPKGDRFQWLRSNYKNVFVMFSVHLHPSTAQPASAGKAGNPR